MVAFTIETESTSIVAPAKLYKVLATDFDNIVPKAVEAIQSIEIIEGNGGPGTIKKITVAGEGSNYVLHKVEAIDEANRGYSYSIVGGVGLPETLDKLLIGSKMVEGPNGGSIVKVTVKVETKGDVQPNEEHAKVLTKTRSDAFFNAIETYLSANPDYN